jgi:hypothetical protein
MLQILMYKNQVNCNSWIILKIKASCLKFKKNIDTVHTVPINTFFWPSSYSYISNTNLLPSPLNLNDSMLK